MKMSTCPSSGKGSDEPPMPIDHLDDYLARSKYACKLQDLLYQQTLQGSDFCDVQLHIGADVSIKKIQKYFLNLYHFIEFLSIL